jgi:hypothetical protein
MHSHVTYIFSFKPLSHAIKSNPTWFVCNTTTTRAPISSLSLLPFLFSSPHAYTCVPVAFRATLKRKNTLAHLDLEKEKQKAFGKKGILAGSGGVTGNPTNGNPANGTNGPVIGGGISLGVRSPTLSAVSKATLITTKKSPSPSPPLKPPKKLIKSTNGMLKIKTREKKPGVLTCGVSRG